MRPVTGRILARQYPYARGPVAQRAHRRQDVSHGRVPLRPRRRGVAGWSGVRRAKEVIDFRYRGVADSEPRC